MLLHDGEATKLTGLMDSTVDYLRKLSGYDTPRLILAETVVLVGSPSDEMVFARVYYDATGDLPRDRGVDFISTGGLTFARALELYAVARRSECRTTRPDRG